jgi:glutamate-5-semialdehyde dehydrogenase
MGGAAWSNAAVTSLERVCDDARAASRVLARMSSHRKNVVLAEMAEAIERRAGEILRENRQDVEAAKRAHAPPALVDRLYLDEDRVADMAECCRKVAALPDPVGVSDRGRRLPNGLEVLRRRVPLGVVAALYDARPAATVDAAALCLKSGNAVILRGSRTALRSNRILVEMLTGAVLEADAPRSAFSLLGEDREELRRLVEREGLVDLVVAAVGEEVRGLLREHARVPVIASVSGKNHVYVHADADVEMALKIAVNAKVHRPGFCSAGETLLVHRDAAAAFLPGAAGRLGQHGVQLRVSPEGLEVLGEAGGPVAEATEDDYGRDLPDTVMAVRVVDSLEQALEHIARHGSGHSEAIVTRSLAAAREFQEAVDAAAVYVNASTRFTAGDELGAGPQIGTSTQKLHVRGPIGLEDLTTYKHLVTGDGHVR